MPKRERISILKDQILFSRCKFQRGDDEMDIWQASALLTKNPHNYRTPSSPLPPAHHLLWA